MQFRRKPSIPLQTILHSVHYSKIILAIASGYLTIILMASQGIFKTLLIISSKYLTSPLRQPCGGGASGGMVRVWIGPIIPFLPYYRFCHLYEHECDTGYQKYCKYKTVILCQ
jgi:hypothetical protein